MLVWYDFYGKSALHVQLVIIETLIFETIEYFRPWTTGWIICILSSDAPLSTVTALTLPTTRANTVVDNNVIAVFALFRCFHCLHLVGSQKVIRTIVHNSPLIIPLYSLLLYLLRSFSFAHCTIMLLNYEWCWRDFPHF